MSETVKVDLAANVWKIVVEVGETVEPDDPIMILESMKMEIPVLSESGGTVTSISVTEGTSVQEGDAVAVVE